MAANDTVQLVLDRFDDFESTVAKRFDDIEKKFDDVMKRFIDIQNRLLHIELNHRF